MTPMLTRILIQMIQSPRNKIAKLFSNEYELFSEDEEENEIPPTGEIKFLWPKKSNQVLFNNYNFTETSAVNAQVDI